MVYYTHTTTAKKALLTLFILCFLTGFSFAAKAQVKWQAFDNAVFIEASKQHRPVLLHLRANWCHWCHVMEENTYTNKDVIKTLNTGFISCNEDHDARPDLTARYFEYGWPATIIFDEKGNELFKRAGYIEAEEFLQILNDIKSGNIKADIKEAQKPLSSEETEQLTSIDRLKDLFYNSLDTLSGGFGFGQKYIDFETFEYALNESANEPLLKNWVTKTARNSIGINDTVWGGIYQYSTHNDWGHAHFEKLLSVQARYMKLYCWHYTQFNDSSSLKKALNIAGYLNRFLKSNSGLYYNSQDADLIKGVKASDYFSLNNKERLNKGVPVVDSNCYTNENAMLAESFLVLWASSGNEDYLKQALGIESFIADKRLSQNGLYLHGDTTNLITLNDNLFVCKMYLALFRATGSPAMLEKSYTSAKAILNTFDSKKHYFNNYFGSTALAPTYNISENIELSRMLNLLFYYTNDVLFKDKAKEILSFLLNKSIVNQMYTEPGLISAFYEIRGEPFNVCFLKTVENENAKSIIKSIVAIPRFYITSGTYSHNNLPASKKDLLESFSENTVFICTDSYCSSPISTNEELLSFINKVILNQKNQSNK